MSLWAADESSLARGAMSCVLQCRFDQLQAVPLQDTEASVHPETVGRDRLRADVPEAFAERCAA